MNLKDTIEKGLREGTKRYNLMMKKKAVLCARDNILIRAQLEAIQKELVKKRSVCGYCSKAIDLMPGRLHAFDPETNKLECAECITKSVEEKEDE